MSDDIHIPNLSNFISKINPSNSPSIRAASLAPPASPPPLPPPSPSNSSSTGLPNGLLASISISSRERSPDRPEPIVIDDDDEEENNNIHSNNSNKYALKPPSSVLPRPPNSASSSSANAHTGLAAASSSSSTTAPTNSTSTATLTAEATATATPAVTAATTTKPKSTKHARPRSPSPSPPPPPAPPLQTIRLEIQLGGPDNYEVDIAGIAKATGQRPPTPVPVKRDTSESEGEGEEDGKGGADADGEGSKGRGKKGKKRKAAGTEYYDLNDPFIDDSELAVDERKFFAQTKQQGFYVSSGEVALLKDKTPKKPKSKKPHDPTHPPHSHAHKTPHASLGTKDAPIALGSDDGEGSGAFTARPGGTWGGGDEDEEKAGVGEKRKARYVMVVEGGKKRRIVDVHSFHPELQEAIEELKAAISQESWEVKGKFPPSIKPLLASVAVKAIKLDEYDEHFFNLMPVLFPYNKYTMTKLIKRTIHQEHTEILTERQDVALGELKALTDAGFARAQEEYEKSVIAWEKRQEKLKADAADAGSVSASADGAPETAASTPPALLAASHHAQGTDDAGSGMDVDMAVPKDKDGKDGKDKDGKDKDPHANRPTQKYRMTDAMKAIVWQLVMLSNEICKIENEKHHLEGSTVQVSEQGHRKALYQRIVAAFPEGWMSSGQISREVSSMKKKHEREAMDNEA